MDVIVIESPNKTKKIAEYTGAEVFATVGHFKDLAPKSMSIDLDTYAPTFSMNDEKKSRINQIKTASKGKKVYIATDPDREGYAIGTFIYEEIKNDAAECWRLEIREITENGIKEAMNNAVRWEQTNNGEYDAWLGRRLGDRLSGYILSPQANTALNGKYSVGRVQSPAVRAVVEREREIKNFKPTPFFTITAEIKHKNGTFTAKYDNNFPTIEEAEALKDSIGYSSTVENLEAKEVNTAPKAPFTTLELQTTASTHLSIPAEKTMEAAQALFEKGLITYHRTDSTRLSEDFVSEVRELIAANFDSEYLCPSVRVYKSKNSQAEAHEAIRPSHVHGLDDVEEIAKKEGLTSQQKAIYELIFKRTVATQMSDVINDVTKVTLKIGDADFTATGKILKFDGYMKLLNDEESDDETEKEGKLPKLFLGDVSDADVSVNSKMTKPKARFTEATLLKFLENKGIGRPSTYASIMKSIFDRGYITVEKKKLHATEAGESIITHLESAAPWVIDYDFTSNMEEYLDKVENKEVGKTWELFCKELHEKMDFFKPSISTVPSEKQIDFAKKIAEKGNLELSDETLGNRELLSKWIDKNSTSSGKSESVGKCGICKEGEIKEWDKSFQCNKCKATVWKDFLGIKITKKQATDLLNKKVVELKGLKGKKEDAKPFDAKANFTNGKVELSFDNKK